MHNKNATDNGVFEEGQGATGAWEMRQISLKLELKGAASSKGGRREGRGQEQMMWRVRHLPVTRRRLRDYFCQNIFPFLRSAPNAD